MELFEFTQTLKNLCDYYERKEPRQGTIELWFEKVKKIPPEPIKWMIKKICDDHEVFPKNLPGAIWGSYREWQQANPDRVAAVTFFDCPDCVDGLIWAKGIHRDHAYGYVFRCAKCRQNNCQQYPMAFRDGLKASYELMPKSGWPYQPRKASSISGLVSDIGKIERVDLE